VENAARFGYISELILRLNDPTDLWKGIWTKNTTSSHLGFPFLRFLVHLQIKIEN